jgi:hypothetical protein
MIGIEFTRSNINANKIDLFMKTFDVNYLIHPGYQETVEAVPDFFLLSILEISPRWKLVLFESLMEDSRHM